MPPTASLRCGQKPMRIAGTSATTKSTSSLLLRRTQSARGASIRARRAPSRGNERLNSAASRAIRDAGLDNIASMASRPSRRHAASMAWTSIVVQDIFACACLRTLDYCWHVDAASLANTHLAALLCLHGRRACSPRSCTWARARARYSSITDAHQMTGRARCEHCGMS